MDSDITQKTDKTNILNMNNSLNGLSINLHGLQPYSSEVPVITMCTVLGKGLWCHSIVELLMAEEW